MHIGVHHVMHHVMLTLNRSKIHPKSDLKMMYTKRLPHGDHPPFSGIGAVRGCVARVYFRYENLMFLLKSARAALRKNNVTQIQKNNEKKQREPRSSCVAHVYFRYENLMFLQDGVRHVMLIHDNGGIHVNRKGQARLSS